MGGPEMDKSSKFIIKLVALVHLGLPSLFGYLVEYFGPSEYGQLFIQIVWGKTSLFITGLQGC